MTRSVEDYAEQLKALLPTGAAWPRDPDSVMGRLLLALAGELARVDLRAADLVRESDPRLAIELLGDWESAFGLPDDCAGEAASTAERRDQLLGRITGIGDQSPAYLIAVADDLGYPVTIDEYNPWTCIDPCNEPIYGEDWWFAFGVNAPAETIREATCMDPCTDPLRSWGNTILECVIDRLKPAHTLAIYSYG